MTLAGNQDWQPRASLATLQRRAEIRRAVRSFLDERGVLEIETPLLQQGANTDPGIMPMSLPGNHLRGGFQSGYSAANRYLPTSPEHPLKRCLAAGYGDCYAMTSVARAGEHGQNHEPVFTMLEWYRLDWDLDQLADETIAVFELALGRALPVHRRTYEDCFEVVLGCSSDDDAALCAVTGDLPTDASLSERADFAMASLIQPAFARDAWTIVSNWPAAQAAQARLHNDGTAARFEIYAGGLELANAYHEEMDADVLANRLYETGKAHDLPADQRLIAAVQAALPPCTGVAVGFDRLIQFALDLTHVADGIAFDWDRA